jgi:ApeA N-terminal domain 1
MPSFLVEPGEYSCEWFVDGHRYPGELDVRGNRFPHLTIYDLPAPDGVIRLPSQEREYERLVGRLRTNHDVVLSDVGLHLWLPGRLTGGAAHAIIGLGVDQVADDRYDRVDIQISGLDEFFGTVPLRDWQWPKLPEEEQRYSVTVNPDAFFKWDEECDGVEIECGYDRSLPLNHFRFELAFAPSVTFRAPGGLAIADWMQQWLQPLLEIVSFATRSSQRVGWLRAASGTGRERVDGAIFGPGIAQTQYQAAADARLSTRPPIFTLVRPKGSLPSLLREWRTLRTGASAFLELYVTAQSDLPARARFLFLIQALEALHGSEAEVEDQASQARFKTRREEVIAEVERLGLNPRHKRFLRDKWAKRMPDDLARRLTELIRQLPAPVRDDLEHQDMSVILGRLNEDAPDERGFETLPERLRALRNQLSHGRRSYTDAELRPWLRAVETISEAHVLRLLGFVEDDITQALTKPQQT